MCWSPSCSNNMPRPLARKCGIASESKILIPNSVKLPSNNYQVCLCVQWYTSPYHHGPYWSRWHTQSSISLSPRRLYTRSRPSLFNRLNRSLIGKLTFAHSNRVICRCYRAHCCRCCRWRGRIRPGKGRLARTPWSKAVWGLFVYWWAFSVYHLSSLRWAHMS